MSVNQISITLFYMSKCNTILGQLHHLLPQNDFDNFVGQHKADKYTKKLKCKNQLTILLYAQASGKDSLRDIETGLSVWDNNWYHLGLKTVAKSTLARANEKRPYQIYESLFYKLLEQCQKLSFGTAQKFSFKNDLYALDSSTIDLCLAIFPWARFRKSKGAIKVHTLFNIRDQIPEVVEISDGKIHDLNIARTLDLVKYAPGTIFIFDRAYVDYALLWKIKKAGHRFVIRLKKNANIIQFLGQDRKVLGKGVLRDELIALALPEAQKSYPDNLRLVTFYDEEHQKTYQFLTNSFKLSALNIAGIYKRRWDIELFFKWIKQHLKVKTFLGSSKNAVMTQIWVAMIYYLLLAFIKFQTKFKGSMLELTRMIEEVLMYRIPLFNILNLNARTIYRALGRDSPTQLAFF